MPQALAEEIKSIPMSPNLGESLERAHAAAREQLQRSVLLEHLLFALTEDPEASIILQSANVDPIGLGADVTSYLAGLGDEFRDGGGNEPRPHAELLRVLQAAASAAQQSKRRQIDGAIVLAAIVGDGKSPAADLLKSHGMTFEEAIRALQRANTKARLKPLAKAPASGPAPASQPQAAVAPRPEPEPQPAPAPEPAASIEPLLEEPPPAAFTAIPAGLEDIVEPAASSSGVQSAEDILAAARIRIQRRAATLNQAPDAPYFSGPPAKEAWSGEGRGPAQPAAKLPAAPQSPAPDQASGAAAAAPRNADRAQSLSKTDAVSEAMRELLVASGVDPAKPAPQPTDLQASLNDAAALLPRDTVVPLRPGMTAADGPPGDPMAFGPQMHPTMPGQARPLAGAERLNPLPPWPGPAAAQPQFQAPNPAAPGPKSATQLDRRKLTRASAPLAPAQAPQRKGAGASERGPLVEAIPRRMRLGFTTEGEVRIAQERVDALVQALSGRRSGQTLGDPVVMRALSVRLRTQDGAFFIEPLTPETQWLEANPHGVHVEPLTWRWAITPRERGAGKLVLLVSMRSIDLDGASEEVGPPDRVVEIKVRGNLVRRMIRRVFWLAAFAGVFMLGHVGGELGPMLWRMLRQIVGL